MFAMFWEESPPLTDTSSHSNSFFIIPVFHFPWSDKGREARVKTERETA